MAIRKATTKDARPISMVLLRSWQTAYRGILPDAVLDAQCLEHFLPYWALTLGTPRESRTWVVERSGEVAGFVHIGPGRDDGGDPERTAELYGMYVDPEHTGSGAGKELMNTAMAHFGSGPWSEATLWVLDGNRAGRDFYESLGWEVEGSSKTVTSVTGHTMEHVRYRIDLSDGDA